MVKEIATDGSHIVNSTPQQIELEGGDGILQLIFFNDQKPGIHLVKLDSTDLSPLPNATFRIEKVGGTSSKEYVTDENGEIDLTNLEPGAYRVTELSAPTAISSTMPPESSKSTAMKTRSLYLPIPSGRPSGW